MVGAALAVVASVALAGSALAADFSNGSFETGSFVNGGSGFETLSAGSNALAPWTVGLGGVDWISTYWNAEAGSYSLDMNATSAGSISQTFDTVAGATYSVGFWLSGNPACGAGTKTLTVQATGGSSASYSYDVTTNLNSSQSPFTITYQHEGYTFTASGTSTTLTFTGDPSAGACGPVLDNVSVTAAATTGASCKDGGWATNTYVDADGAVLTFKNQGQCVSYFATRGAVPIGS
jgi:choice-of-anchor C domain-containing protein